MRRNQKYKARRAAANAAFNAGYADGYAVGLAGIGCGCGPADVVPAGGHPDYRSAYDLGWGHGADGHVCPHCCGTGSES